MNLQFGNPKLISNTCIVSENILFINYNRYFTDISEFKEEIICVLIFSTLINLETILTKVIK